jgi:MHS family proline/betaine transporter-like MFS transporter
MKKTTSFTKIVGSASIGNVLEYYDFLLFVYLAPHISPLFFPAEDKVTAIIAGLGVYALGYFMRPLGAIVFGYMGDVYGRKQALTVSIIMMAIPTFLMGCLPTYQAIGILAPILMIICRLVQGLSVGGEYIGAGIFSVENVVANRRSFAGSFITSTSGLGGLLGSLVATLVFLPFMPPWAWRGAFMLGAFIGLFGLYIRLKVMENNPISSQGKRAPLMEAIKQHPRSIICTFGIAACSGVMNNLTLSYVSVFLTVFKGWPLYQALSVMSFAKVLYVILNPVVGKIADHFGERIMMVSGAIATLVCIYPVVVLLNNSHTIMLALGAVIPLAILSSWFQAPMNSYMSSLFPTACRYSGVAFGYSVGIACFGGTTSMILTYLIQWTNNALITVVYVIFSALLGLFAVLASKQYRTTNKTNSTKIKNRRPAIALTRKALAGT